MLQDGKNEDPRVSGHDGHIYFHIDPKRGVKDI